jgi:hypothetical protein
MSNGQWSREPFEEPIDPAFLQTWGQGLPAPLQDEDEPDQLEELIEPSQAAAVAAGDAPVKPTPTFPQDDQLNRKLILWRGDISALKVVHLFHFHISFSLSLPRSNIVEKCIRQ